MYKISRSFRMLFLVLSLVGLSGCFVSSPYHGQVFSSANALIPVQVWSNNKDNDIVVSCHKGHISGLYRSSINDWQVVRRLPAQLPGSLDSSGSRAYSFGEKIRFPSSCWQRHEFNVGYRHMTAIRFTQVVNDLFSGGQSTRNSYVFDKPGLACAGEAIGEAGKWNGFLGNNCNKTYGDTSSALPFLLLYADD